MTSYKVHMLAFLNGEIREVAIEDNYSLTHEQTLEEIFKYGQNDFVPMKMPSVSVGDVIELDEKLYIVCPIGFREMSIEGFDTYKNKSIPERILEAYKIVP